MEYRGIDEPYTSCDFSDVCMKHGKIVKPKNLFPKKKKKMKKFDVTLYYHTNVTVTVKAKDEDEALDLAYNEVYKKKYNEQILSNLDEYDAPDVYEVEE